MRKYAKKKNQEIFQKIHYKFLVLNYNVHVVHIVHV